MLIESRPTFPERRASARRASGPFQVPRNPPGGGRPLLAGEVKRVVMSSFADVTVTDHHVFVRRQLLQTTRATGVEFIRADANLRS